MKRDRRTDAAACWRMVKDHRMKSLKMGKASDDIEFVGNGSADEIVLVPTDLGFLINIFATISS